MISCKVFAVGVPVSITAAAGSVVRDGTGGRIVSEQDPVALADAIEKIVEYRDKGGRMTAAALQRAVDDSCEHCGERFIDAIRSFRG